MDVIGEIKQQFLNPRMIKRNELTCIPRRRGETFPLILMREKIKNLGL